MPFWRINLDDGFWQVERALDPLEHGHHFGLNNGLETSLVTLCSVTFWSRNGLKNCLETRSHHSVLLMLCKAIQGVQGVKGGV